MIEKKSKFSVLWIQFILNSVIPEQKHTVFQCPTFSCQYLQLPFPTLRNVTYIIHYTYLLSPGMQIKYCFELPACTLWRVVRWGLKLKVKCWFRITPIISLTSLNAVVNRNYINNVGLNLLHWYGRKLLIFLHGDFIFCFLTNSLLFDLVSSSTSIVSFQKINHIICK